NRFVALDADKHSHHKYNHQRKIFCHSLHVPSFFKTRSTLSSPPGSRTKPPGAPSATAQRARGGKSSVRSSYGFNRTSIVITRFNCGSVFGSRIFSSTSFNSRSKTSATAPPHRFPSVKRCCL